MSAEEGNARRVGRQGARRIGHVLRLIQMLREQILLGGGENLVNDFVDAEKCLRIAGMMLECLAIQISGAAAGGHDPVAARECRAGALEEGLQRRLGGWCLR